MKAASSSRPSHRRCCWPVSFPVAAQRDSAATASFATSPRPVQTPTACTPGWMPSSASERTSTNAKDTSSSTRNRTSTPRSSWKPSSSTRRLPARSWCASGSRTCSPTPGKAWCSRTRTRPVRLSKPWTASLPATRWLPAGSRRRSSRPPLSRSRSPRAHRGLNPTRLSPRPSPRLLGAVNGSSR